MRQPDAVTVLANGVDVVAEPCRTHALGRRRDAAACVAAEAVAKRRVHRSCVFRGRINIGCVVRARITTAGVAGPTTALAAAPETADTARCRCKQTTPVGTLGTRVGRLLPIATTGAASGIHEVAQGVRVAALRGRSDAPAHVVFSTSAATFHALVRLGIPAHDYVRGPLGRRAAAHGGQKSKAEHGHRMHPKRTHGAIQLHGSCHGLKRATSADSEPMTQVGTAIISISGSLRAARPGLGSQDRCVERPPFFERDFDAAQVRSDPAAQRGHLRKVAAQRWAHGCVMPALGSRQERAEVSARAGCELRGSDVARLAARALADHAQPVGRAVGEHRPGEPARTVQPTPSGDEHAHQKSDENVKSGRGFRERFSWTPGR